MTLGRKGDNHYFINRSLMYQYSFQQLCKSLNLKYKQMQIINSYETAISGLAQKKFGQLQKVKYYQDKNTIC